MEIKLDHNNGRFGVATTYNGELIFNNLNFEDVMNYYGVVQVLEWAEANR